MVWYVFTTFVPEQRVKKDQLTYILCHGIKPTIEMIGVVEHIVIQIK